nr:condensation domain-containing protein [Paenibacillus turpanensis]
MLDIWRDILGVRTIGIRDNFFESGGDSIKAMQFVSRLQQHNLEIEVRHLFQHPTVASLVPYVKQMSRVIDQGIVEGELPLTPIQSYFFEQRFTTPHHWNQAFMLFSKEGFDSGLVERTLHMLTLHHDALRMVFQMEEGNVRALNCGLEGTWFRLDSVDLRHELEPDELVRIEADRIQASLNIEEGPLLSAGLFRTRDGDHLLLCIHHLVVDGVSWRILLEDFRLVYESLSRDQHAELPRKTSSYLEYAQKLAHYSTSYKALRELDYWREQLRLESRKLPLDYNNRDCRESSTSEWSFVLSEEKTRDLLTLVHKAYNTDIRDILLSGLGIALRKWTGFDRIMVYLESHGREKLWEELDLNRTVGWFTAIYPLVLDMTNTENIAHHIKLTKEHLRKVPLNGVGYGVLRYAAPSATKEELAYQEEPQIMFNYLGQFDEMLQEAPFTVSSLPAGMWKGPDNQRECPIEINGYVQNGCLTMSFEYSSRQFNSFTIERFALLYHQSLEAIIEHCLQQEKTEITPSDVGYSRMSIEDLQKLTQFINR